MRTYGSGSIYRQHGSSRWYTNVHGHCESTGTSNRREALNILRDRLAEIRTGAAEVGNRAITVRKLVEDKLAMDMANQLASYDDNLSRWNNHIAPQIGDFRVSRLTTAVLTGYIRKRREENAGISNCALNRELALVRAALYDAQEANRIKNVPHFPMLKEEGARKGFLTQSQYDSLSAECEKVGPWLRAMFEIGCSYGWRKGELLQMRVGQIDLQDKTIRLHRSKNGLGRVVVMTEKVAEALKACADGKGQDDYLFTRYRGKKRVADFRGTWATVARLAGCSGLLFHDLRRTAARNLRKLVGESVAMKVTGHKTAAVFKRYDIVDEEEVREVALRLDQQAKEGHQISYSLAIVSRQSTEEMTK